MFSRDILNAIPAPRSGVIAALLEIQTLYWGINPTWPKIPRSKLHWYVVSASTPNDTEPLFFYIFLQDFVLVTFRQNPKCVKQKLVNLRKNVDPEWVCFVSSWLSNLRLYGNYSIPTQFLPNMRYHQVNNTYCRTKQTTRTAVQNKHTHKQRIQSEVSEIIGKSGGNNWDKCWSLVMKELYLRWATLTSDYY